MNMRIAAIGGLAVLAVIVVAAIVLSNPLSTEATAKDTAIADKTRTQALPRADVQKSDSVARPDSMGQLQAAPDSDEEAKPYIGVVIHQLSDGSVKVVKVLQDGPSDGVLESGDVVTAVNGEAIGAAEDLTDAIADAGAGAAITLTITRDGSGMDVTVTVGEWEAEEYRKGHKAGDRRDRFSSSEVVMADEDGDYHTYRTVFGSVSALDADAGTFTLQPMDGSAPIDYSVNDDTRIYAGGGQLDDLSGLNTDGRIIVMDVDGEVRVVKQDDTGRRGRFGHRFGRMHKSGPRGVVHHRRSSDRLDVDDTRVRTNALGSGRGIGGFRFGYDTDTVSSLLEDIDESVLDAYAPDGFQDRLRSFLEDPGSGGKIWLKRDGDGLSVNLETEDDVFSFTIPASELSAEDMF